MSEDERKLVRCPNCGREVMIIYEASQYECPHCGQRWGNRKIRFKCVRVGK